MIRSQVNGFVARYQHTQDDEAHRAVASFYDILTQSHSYATGAARSAAFKQMFEAVSQSRLTVSCKQASS